VLLLATVVLTGCRLAEHGRRAAIDAFASFVLDSVFQAPLTQPAPKVARVPPPRDRQECLSYTEPVCRVKRVEVRMALAELRGLKVRRIIVIAPDPATL
jgi:hypothetical protein